MQIKILSKESNQLKIEITGEGHTLCNSLQKALLADEAVEMAGYNVPHPLIDRAIIYVTTNNKRPEVAMLDASKHILKQSKDFKKSFKQALKNWRGEK